MIIEINLIIKSSVVYISICATLEKKLSFNLALVIQFTDQ